ncbi:MAG: hypothetical protein A2660_02440 [Candidatus Doudnabacteria bacterium RIFCSPHIGHO2_01_FULL_45_18]|uniref:SpoVT-AbrB domain-containing protein n=1 Tax=Candidatus Doudnabacteria bacterium RIFCSPHIGHO2_01_FULL_45_18 TaxID=1817823 RepID=A0A1F5NR73_9BACT|nr:MAG: hypothetical protein A2660_02440 [Candidatus Doudnabacteria bacterium RIFCSPHIGHO2_01_FULL_45_18]
MPRKIDNKRKLTRIGKSSLGLLLPAQMLRDLKWREKEMLIVKRIPGGLAIHNAKTKKRKK